MLDCVAWLVCSARCGWSCQLVWSDLRAALGTAAGALKAAADYVWRLAPANPLYVRGVGHA